MAYFTALNGKQEGPFTEEELHRKLGISPDPQTLVWKEGMENWLPIGQVLPGLSVSALSSVPGAVAPSTSWTPAPRLSRFLAALVDISPLFLFGFFAALVIPIMTKGKASDSSAGFTILMACLVLFVLILAAVQITMLVLYSQSIGKKVLQIRIYDVETGLPANWVKTILLRMIVNAIPSMIPFIGGIYSLTDILFIFRDDRRCVHDLIAGTVVGTVPK